MEAAYVNLQNLAKRLGLSTRTIRNHIHSIDDPLPARLVGGRYLMDLREVDAWLERRRVVTKPLDSLVNEVLMSLTKRNHG